MTLTVNGVDVLPYVAYQGYDIQRADVDGEDAGRAANGTMWRDRRATKHRIDVTCIPLTATECHNILNAILPEFFSVTYTDPEAGTDVTCQMYSNNFHYKYVIKKNGVDLWQLSFPLIEQ